MATYRLLDNDGRQWFELDGVDTGTGYEFDHDVYGLSDVLIDCDGYPVTPDGNEYLAVMNTIKCEKFNKFIRSL